MMSKCGTKTEDSPNPVSRLKILSLQRLFFFPLGLIDSPVEGERRGELEEAHVVLERELAKVLVVDDAGHGPRLLGPVVGRQAVLAGDDLKRY